MMIGQNRSASYEKLNGADVIRQAARRAHRQAYTAADGVRFLCADLSVATSVRSFCDRFYDLSPYFVTVRSKSISSVARASVRNDGRFAGYIGSAAGGSRFRGSAAGDRG